MSEGAMADQIFAYVPHSRQRQFEALGWEFSNDLGPPHCAYASLYKWAGEGLPIYPEDDICVGRRRFEKREDDRS
jgi:hypothetical protein